MIFYDVVIVGGGHAGAHAATLLRGKKFTGTIAIIGAEAEPPYERPPLSKEYFSGEKSFERILIRPESFWKDKMIDMISGQRVTNVDAEKHELTTDSGDVYHYGKLIWATGGQARKLACSGHQLTGLHTVRNRKDVDQMISELDSVNNIVIIGAGYIGLEAAAVLSKMGKSVTVLEAQDRVLRRVAGEELSRFFEAEHKAHGIDIRFNAAVDCIRGDKQGRVSSVELANGESLPACMVIAGIGIVPAVEEILQAGARGKNGV